MYLFYFPSLSEWRIGSNYTGSTSSLKSIGDATRLCPDEATGWQAAVTAGWDDTYPIIVAPIPTCNSTVAVSGAEAVVSGSMGTYTKMAGLEQADRPMYQLAGATVAYLYYWHILGIWVIGSSYASDAAGVKSAATAAGCPDEATGWQAYAAASGAWVSTDPITVAPAESQTRPPMTASPTNVGNIPPALRPSSVWVL